MLSITEKIKYFKRVLEAKQVCYADSFKTDILLIIDDYDESNPDLNFLRSLSTYNEISDWIDKLTSRIVMKEDVAGVSDIICDYIEFG